MVQKMRPSPEMLKEMLENVDTNKIRSPQDWDTMISDLIDFQDDMTEWEYDFMNSMVEIAEKGVTPSPKQKDVLKKLEEKYL